MGFEAYHAAGTDCLKHGTLRTRLTLHAVALIAPLLLLLQDAPCAFGRESQAVSVPGYTRQLWQTQDGLPEGIVQAIAQTEDGYLWVGTTGGLLRFDGARFTLFAQANTPAFHADSVFCLARTHDNALWIGTEGGGLIRYRDGAFRAYSHADGLTDDFIRTVFEDSKGRIWVGTDGGLFQVRGESVIAVRYPEMGVEPVAVHAIAEDRQGSIWVGGSKLFRLMGGEAVEYPLQGVPEQLAIKSLLPQPDGTVLVGTVSGLMRLRIGSGRASAAWSKVNGVAGTVRVLRKMKEGSVWIGTIGHGVFVLDNGSLKQYAAPDVLPSNIVLAIHEDTESNIWLGMQTGMLRLSRTEVTAVKIPGVADSDFGSISRDRRGDLWIASSRLYRFHDGKMSEYRVPGAAGVKIRNVLEDDSGALWMGTEGQGIYKIRGRTIVHYTKRHDGLANNFVRAMLQARDQTIWVATDGGISHWVNLRWQTYLQQNGLSYFSTRTLLQSTDGDIWIGTDGGLSHWHNGTFLNDEITRAFRQERVWSIYQDSDGGFWFGTRGDGLYRWCRGKLAHYTTIQGLASNSVYSILEDASGRVWMSGPNAVTMVTRKDIDLAGDNPAFPPRFQLYGISEGLPTTQMYGGIQPAGALAANGEIWFPSAAGPIRIHPDGLAASKAPTVVLDDLSIDGRAATLGNSLDLGTGGSRLEFHFRAIQLSAHDRVRYRYKLDGFDRGWNPTTQGVASYTNLPPGKYRFRVEAFDVNDPELSTQAWSDLRRRPHFYQTVWFALLCLALCGGAAWSLHWRKTRRMQEKFDAVIGERSRVAGEIHDTLIQGCTSVSSLLEAHRSLEDQGVEHDNKLLHAASLQVRSTIDEARQAIWGLRSGAVAVKDIAADLTEIAKQVDREFQLPIRCKIKGRSMPVGRNVAHELMMVTREALYNAARHGNPQSVELLVQFDASALEISIRDDGAGFEVSQAAGAGDRHYGLAVMQERIERLGGKFTIETSAGQGARLTITMKKARLFVS